MTQPAARPDRSSGGGRGLPRPPAYAWAWVQRSRPVLHEVAVRLTGAPPGPGFVQRLRDDFSRDPFVRDVLVGGVADIAFGGRVPPRRPVGASWDRGLVWWAAVLAGETPAEFEARSAAAVGRQSQLFGSTELAGSAEPARPDGDWSERRQLAGRLRDLLAVAAGDQVPASAIRQLIAELEGRR